MMSTNPFDDLVDVRPVLDACNKPTGSSACKCTDPGHKYNTPCVMGKGDDDHTGRSHCYYGAQPIDSEGWKRAKPDKDGTQYFIGSATRIRAPFEQSDVTNKPAYPRSLMFCAHPHEDDGDAAPTATKSKVNVSSTSDTWDTENPNSGGTTNLGFE